MANARDNFSRLRYPNELYPPEDGTAEIAQRLNEEREESSYWEYHQPESPLGRSQVWGLIAVVRAGEEEQVVVPVELREILPDLRKGRN